MSGAFRRDRRELRRRKGAQRLSRTRLGNRRPGPTSPAKPSRLNRRPRGSRQITKHRTSHKNAGSCWALLAVCCILYSECKRETSASKNA
jgi:hypothetical protein